MRALVPSSRTIVGLLVALGAGARALAAQGALPAGVVLRPTVEVRVELSHAARLGRLPRVRHGAVERASTDTLTLALVRPAEHRAFAWTHVVWLDTLTRQHSRWRNATIGAVFGSVSLGWFVYHANRGFCEHDCASDGQAVLAGSVYGATLGALASLVFPPKREWARVLPPPSS